MNSSAKWTNRALFLVCVALTGMLAGSFVWLFFWLMDKGIAFIWNTVPHLLGTALGGVCPVLVQGTFGFVLYPLIVCVLGGLCIGAFNKKTGVAPEELNQVMAHVKKTGRYSYNNLGKLSLSALLPLLFGGSVGPEAGLTGVIAGLCTWVGDRMRRFGADFRALTLVGTQATLTALFTAPLYAFVAPLSGTTDALPEGATITLPKQQKIVVYVFAITGALGAFLLLGDLFGGSGGLPRFADITIGTYELALLIPLALCGTACGWAYHASRTCTERFSEKLGDRPVAKALIAGVVLALCGTVLPYTLFAGETQIHYLEQGYAAMGAAALLATGFVKAAVTPLCINFGWRGGHFFPLIFSGVALGYGFSLLTGANPVFCLAVCTAGLMGAVMRSPLMAALLLFLCFPVKGVAVMLLAAVIGSAVSLPRALRPMEEAAVQTKEAGEAPATGEGLNAAAPAAAKAIAAGSDVARSGAETQPDAAPVSFGAAFSAAATNKEKGSYV